MRRKRKLDLLYSRVRLSANGEREIETETEREKGGEKGREGKPATRLAIRIRIE